nr:hypothetical protein [Natrialba sp. PRR66]
METIVEMRTNGGMRDPVGLDRFEINPVLFEAFADPRFAIGGRCVARQGIVYR